MKTEQKQLKDDQCGSQGLCIGGGGGGAERGHKGTRSNAHTARQAPLVNLEPREALPCLV